MPPTSTDHAERKRAFLTSHGADEIGHGIRDLLTHLEGTEAFLQSWGGRQALCDAGLFHSVYGTESFGQQLIPEGLREEVQALIGVEAERLAWLFGVLNKASLYSMLDQANGHVLTHRSTGDALPVTVQEYRDLCEMTVANWLDQRPTAPPKYQFLRAESFEKMRAFIGESAREALDAAYGFKGEAALP